MADWSVAMNGYVLYAILYIAKNPASSLVLRPKVEESNMEL